MEGRYVRRKIRERICLNKEIETEKICAILRNCSKRLEEETGGRLPTCLSGPR